ncbi:MAG: RnfH family protein [Betaproteobacteria bacterium]|nr:RnfH family protein [Betaproteobacteria bacterium]
MNAKEIDVQVVCALASRQEMRAIKLPEGSTVLDAVLASGLLAAFPEIALDRSRLGIFGRLVGADAPLREGDRVEIYRPLAADPNENRRRRAARAKRGR